MPHESPPWVARTAERVTDSIRRVIDSEYMPPINLAALGALAGFTVAAAGIAARQTVLESIQGQEQYCVEGRE